MILQNTITKTTFIPQGQFVNVNVWSHKSKLNEKTGIRLDWLECHEEIINISLVSQLKKVTSNNTETLMHKYPNSHRPQDWVRYSESKTEPGFSWCQLKNTIPNITKSIEVYELTKLSSDIELSAKYVTFDVKVD